MPIETSTCLFLQELLQLEEDVKLLEEMYPQGEKVDCGIYYYLLISIVQLE